MARRTSQRMMEKELVHLAFRMTIKVNSSLGCVFPSAHVSFLFFFLETTECLNLLEYDCYSVVLVSAVKRSESAVCRHSALPPETRFHPTPIPSV